MLCLQLILACVRFPTGVHVLLSQLYNVVKGFLRRASGEKGELICVI